MMRGARQVGGRGGEKVIWSLVYHVTKANCWAIG